MNGIEKIIERIQAETNAACMMTSGEAAERCAAIRMDYADKAVAAYKEAIDKGTEELRQAGQRMDRNARLDARKDILGLKQEMVDKAFQLARQKLLGLPQDKYAAYLASLAARASVTGDEEIVFTAADREKLGEAVTAQANAALAAAGKKAGLTLSAETREFDGGLVLRKGDIEVNCTVDTLLELSRQELTAEVAGILFD